MLRFFHIIKFNLFSRPDELKVAYLKIEGLKSDSSLLVINDAVRKKPGIVSVSVDLASKVATFVYDSRVTAIDFLIDHIHNLNEGFTAWHDSDLYVLHVQGLNCGKCVRKIESSFEEGQVRVNLAQGKAFCEEDKQRTYGDVIRGLGFKAVDFGPRQGRVLLNVSICFF